LANLVEVFWGFATVSSKPAPRPLDNVPPVVYGRAMTKTSVPPRSAFITRLQQIIVEEGRRQSWLAEVTGIDAGTLNRYIHGLFVPKDRRKPIAEALGRTVRDVFGPVQQ
jgi:hypothetical protein